MSDNDSTRPDGGVVAGDPEGVECPACELVTVIMYRCQHCGHDLAGDKATEGRQ